VARRLAAILAADVVGYSRLMAADEAGTHARLKALRKDFVEPEIARHHGRVVKLMGDGALVEFGSAVEAVECAVAIQGGVTAREAGECEDRRLAFRIGINIGDIIIEDDDIYGGGVNIAARLEALSPPGGICVARNVYNQVKDKVTVGFAPMGEHRVKNIPEPVTAYRVITGPRQAMRTPGIRSWPAAALAAALVLLLGAGGVWWTQRDSEDVAAPAEAVVVREATLDPHRLAVLPFVNISASAEDEYFSDGITEELISRLSRLGELTVIARTSVMQYKQTAKSIAEIGRELGVGTILEGSVRKAGDRLRVTAQLIDVSSQGHLWAEDYDRQLADIFAVQGDVAQNVVDALRVTLLPGEKQTLDRHGTDNVVAYNLYLKGLYHWHKLTRDNLEKAKSYFEQAIKSDDSFAGAHAWLAYTHQILGEFGHTPPGEAYEVAKAMALKAIDLDPAAPDAYAVLATIRAYYDWDWAGAETAYKKAIELNPNNVVARWNYGILLLTPLLRHEESIATIRRALELEPLEPWISADLAWAYNAAGRFDEAIAVSTSTIDLDPGFSYAHASLGYAWLQTGKPAEAIAEFEKEVELTGREPFATARLGWGYGMAGKREQALDILEELQTRAEQEHIDPLALVWVYSGLDMKDKAFAWLEKAYQERSSWMIFLQSKDHYYAPLRSDPRYHEMLRKVGLIGGGA
jgi:adenylate cyclase